MRNNITMEILHSYILEDEEDSLCHYGVMGMKWGIRRYEPYSKNAKRKGKFVGKIKKAVKEHTPTKRKVKHHIKKSKKHLRELFNRVKDREYTTLATKAVNTAVSKILPVAAGSFGIGVLAITGITAINMALDKKKKK